MILSSFVRLSLALPALVLWLGACGDGNTDVRHYRVKKVAPVPGVATPVAAPGEMPKAAPDLPPPPSGPGFTWTVPDGWKPAQAGSMRIASFVVPTDAGDGDLSVVRLGGGAGGFVPNINRWRGQIGLAPADEASIMAAAVEGKAPVGPFTALKLVNPDNGKAMLAAVFSLDSATLFVKLTASAAVVDGLEKPFTDFCSSIAEAAK
ncbi:MAG: hypothetical protein EP329_02715 [Deltaproteobacteria bacterium]|nr:MAG: hypothetical protein EP329_02715 [Deltaproteobacteria bacterium]